MIDEVLTQENREIEALVALLDQEQGEHENSMSDYGSDDEGYDRIFMDAVAAAESQRTGSEQVTEAQVELDLEMDTSSG